MRRTRVFAVVFAVFAALVASAAVGEAYIGDRVFLRNSSACDIALSEEHSGSTIRPGDRALAKSAFIDHSPTMMLVSKEQAWTGLRFWATSVETRTREGAKVQAAVPPEWWKLSLLGKELTLQVNRSGQLLVEAPTPDLSNASQPPGFPLPGLPATIPMQKELACRCVPVNSDVRPHCMPLDESIFLREVTTALASLGVEFAGTPITVSTRHAVDEEKIVAEVHGPKHVALVEAWQNAQCLDITVLRIGSENGTILASGPCDTEAELSRRIEQLRQILLHGGGEGAV